MIGMQWASVTLLWLGSALVVIGGLVAAVTGPLNLARGSWLAAYLVLVCGVAQSVMGLAREYLGGRRLAPRWAWTQLLCWNAGNAAVIAGTLSRVPVLVDLGGAVLLVALGIALQASRRPSHRVLGWAFRGVMVVLVVSIPIGLVLASVRAGG